MKEKKEIALNETSLFSAGRLSESLCLPRAVDGSIWAEIGEYMFAILPQRRILEDRIAKFDNLIPQRSSRTPGIVENNVKTQLWHNLCEKWNNFWNKHKFPLMLKKICLGITAAQILNTWGFTQSPLRTSLFLSLDLRWERERREVSGKQKERKRQ